MNRYAFLATALLLPWVAAPAASAQVSATAAPQPASVPAIKYSSRTLANGLRVFTIPDQSSPNVSVQVWYDVGSKDDPAGRSGFAHLFEHMLFKSTRNMANEQFDRMTEDVGGFNNAGTNDDYTNYYEVVPANHLERLLWAEAERMGSLVVDPKVFASERDVVKEELRARVLAAPYGKLFYLYIPQVSYSHHPYARPGIGSIDELDAATIDDVRAFHATYYRPDNAVLVVAGRFDQAQLDRWIDEYFGAIPRPETAIPRVRVTEPERTRARSFTVYEANTPLPAVMLTYLTRPRRTKTRSRSKSLMPSSLPGEVRASTRRSCTATASRPRRRPTTTSNRAPERWPLMRSSPAARPQRKVRWPFAPRSPGCATRRLARQSWLKRRTSC